MKRGRRISASLALSVGLHIVLGAGILELLLMPHPYNDWLHLNKGNEPIVERIGFVATPKTGETNPGKAGGDGRTVSKTHPHIQLVAPSAVPTGITAPPTSASTEPEGGTGPVIGKGGETEGVAPKFSDPRVWVGPAPVVTAPKTMTQHLDSAMASQIKAHNDTALAMGSGRKPGDWTFGSDGHKWGVDPKWIHLGSFSLPTAILGALPLNATGNPVLAQREAQLNAMHEDIQFHANQAINEDQFRIAVKELRERKERERKRQDQPQGQDKEPTLATDASNREPVIPQP